jgi:CHASE2 domain-containing sensor protein
MAEPAATGSRFKHRTHVAALIGILLAGGTGWFLHTFRLGAGLKQASYDLLHISRGDVKTDEALIVYLDDDSHQKLKQPQNAPWDRSLHAQLVERLTAAGARAIVFDIVFSDPDPAPPVGPPQPRPQ